MNLDVQQSELVELAGSMSRSGLYRVPLGGRDAVLKVTGANEGQDGARRELAFYQTLADRVPVMTPRLLDHIDTDEVTGLLLSPHTPGPPARRWERSAWLEVARQLAALHSFPLPDAEKWRHPSWFPGVLDRPPIAAAHGYWSGTGAAGLLGRVLEAPAALAHAVNATPECFIHGDCHVDNLLREGDRLVWADWQATGLGSPAVDLAFLWGFFWRRRTRVPLDPPRDAMLREYATCRGLDLAPLHRSVVAAELGTLLFGWPGSAARHSRDEQDRTTARFTQVIQEWHALSE
jgi:aminoglycoside phosphotransferase (APT) family kinase protein